MQLMPHHPRPLMGMLMAFGFLSLAGTVSANGDASASSGSADPDAQLVSQLQVDSETRQAVVEGMGNRLTPAQIRAMREQLEMEEAARQNPQPPEVANKVISVERGQSPQITIMARFDSTLMFTDRTGEPINIRSWRISDRNAAELIPLHERGEGSESSEVEMVGPQTGGGASSLGNNAGGSGDGGSEGADVTTKGAGPVTGLIVSPRKSMRSTNITVRVKGETYPIIVTVSTRPSTQSSREVAFINEVRLNWIVDMPEVSRAAGGYQHGSAISQGMLSLLQGVPGPHLESVELEGALSEQMSLWRDATKPNDPTYFLRLADHISVWNIAIADRSNDRMRGFSVIELQGMPPKSMGFTANGQYTTVSIAE